MGRVEVRGGVQTTRRAALEESVTLCASARGLSPSRDTSITITRSMHADQLISTQGHVLSQGH